MTMITTEFRLYSIFIALAATFGCHQPPRGLPTGLVPRVSTDLARGQIVGVVVDSASQSALGYAQVLLLSDTTPGSALGITAAGHADGDGHFALHADTGGVYTLHVRHVGHRSLRALLHVPDSSGVFVTVTLARDSVACATWPDLCN